MAGVVEKLSPDRLVEAELMTQDREPFRRDAALAHAHLDRIAGHEADRDEGQEHQRQKRRDGQRDAAYEIDQHGAIAVMPGLVPGIHAGASAC